MKNNTVNTLLSVSSNKSTPTEPPATTVSSSSSSNAPGANAMHVLRKKQFFRTKICPWYFRGKCDRGPDCLFAHSIDDIQTKPDLAYTSFCPNIRKPGGTCNEKNCSYAHSADELRCTGDLYKTAPCSRFMIGKCSAGIYCRHAHNILELRPLPGEEHPSTDVIDRMKAALASRCATELIHKGKLSRIKDTANLDHHSNWRAAQSNNNSVVNPSDMEQYLKAILESTSQKYPTRNENTEKNGGYGAFNVNLLEQMKKSANTYSPVVQHRSPFFSNVLGSSNVFQNAGTSASKLPQQSLVSNYETSIPMSAHGSPSISNTALRNASSLMKGSLHMNKQPSFNSVGLTSVEDADDNMICISQKKLESLLMELSRAKAPLDHDSHSIPRVGNNMPKVASTPSVSSLPSTSNISNMRSMPNIVNMTDVRNLSDSPSLPDIPSVSGISSLPNMYNANSSFTQEKFDFSKKILLEDLVRIISSLKLNDNTSGSSLFQDRNELELKNSHESDPPFNPFLSDISYNKNFFDIGTSTTSEMSHTPIYDPDYIYSVSDFCNYYNLSQFDSTNAEVSLSMADMISEYSNVPSIEEPQDIQNELLNFIDKNDLEN